MVYCKNALLVMESMLKIKINKLLDFTVSVLAAICFCHGQRCVGLRQHSINFAVNLIDSDCKTFCFFLITRYHFIFVPSFII